MVDKRLSGFDMKDTIYWYEEAGIRLPNLHVSNGSQRLNLTGNFKLSSKELEGLLNLFPQNARQRSILRQVKGLDSLWFHRDTNPEKPISTTDREQALSETAIIPSYIDYTKWQETEIPQADIVLYKIPEDLAPEDVRRLITTQGFVHELGHSIIQPAMYIPNYELILPDKRQVNGFDLMFKFARLAENHAPISHYASTYRGPNNKFEGGEDYNAITAISEELAETIAAHLLGFAYCGNDKRGKAPLEDRAEIKVLVNEFLNAQLKKE